MRSSKSRTEKLCAKSPPDSTVHDSKSRGAGMRRSTCHEQRHEYIDMAPTERSAWLAETNRAVATPAYVTSSKKTILVTNSRRFEKLTPQKLDAIAMIITKTNLPYAQKV